MVVSLTYYSTTPNPRAMNYTAPKANRLAQLDKEIIERVKEIQQLIKPGEDSACYYLSNLRTAGDANDTVMASVGHPAIIAGLLVLHSEGSPAILDALPLARQAMANCR